MHKRILGIAAASAMLLSACQPMAGGDTIKIGMIAPLTGDVSTVGQDFLHGAQMAIDEVNAAGGINGKQVTLIAEDGKCAGGDSASAAQKLVNVDKVIAILGGQCSGETLAAAPIVEAGKVVLLSSWSSNPAVTDAGDYVFRNYPSDALKTKAMAAYFAKKGYKTVALIGENTDFAVGFRDSLIKDLPPNSIVFSELVEPGTKDFRSLLTRLKDVEFDVFVPDANQTAVAGELLKQLREAGFTQPVVGQDVIDATDVVAAVGDLDSEIYLINVPTVGEGSALETAFKAKHGEPQAGITYVALAYDSAKILMEGLKTAKTSEELKNWMNSMPTHAGVSGNVSFDENGDVIGLDYALKQFKDGKIVELEAIAVD
jgi:branched-chain amino acid transport system substrate-binding protein